MFWKNYLGHFVVGLKRRRPLLADVSYLKNYLGNSVWALTHLLTFCLLRT